MSLLGQSSCSGLTGSLNGIIYSPYRREVVGEVNPTRTETNIFVFPAAMKHPELTEEDLNDLICF